MYKVISESNNVKRKTPPFQPGDLVLLRCTRFGSKSQGTATKLFYQQTGPHLVKKHLADRDIFEIQLGDTNFVKQVPGFLLQKLPARMRDPKPMVRSWFLDDREFLRTQHNHHTNVT